MADSRSETNHDEFVRLLASNSQRIYAFVRTLALNDENDAEEVFQSTSVTLWKKFDEYDPSGDFGAWGCRIAFYETLRLREQRKRIRHLTDEAIASLADAAGPIFRTIGDRRAALSECLEKLPPEDLATIHTRYLDGVRPKEIAKRLGRSAPSIYRELSRIHRTLLRCVERTLQAEANA